MADKPKIALYWCASCGGCEESVLDMAEDLISLVERAEIVFWPVAIDARKQDLEALGDGDIDLTLINGAVRTDEQADMAHLLRRKSRIVMAHGACAHLGGVVGLANLFDRHEILDRVYREIDTVANPDGILPSPHAVGKGDEPRLAQFDATVRTLDQTISVDYTIPGCPPTPDLVRSAIFDALDGKLPEKGSVLADHRALCHSCPRAETRSPDTRIRRFHRLYESEWDSDRCFLDQGLICLGPATRGGCNARCITGNMPCRGCFGPTGSVTEGGARSIAMLADLLEESVDPAHGLSSIPDPTGLVYRYGLPASILKRKAR